MFFKYDSITGRVGSASQTSAYTPQGFSRLLPENTSFFFDSSTTRAAQAPEFNIQQAAAESSGATAGKAKGMIPSGSAYAKITNLQKSWGTNALMVWQKRGGRDSSLYFFTLGAMVISCGVVFKTIYEMSFPKKKED